MEKHPDGQNYNACLKDGASNKTSNIKCGLSMENCGHTYLKNGEPRPPNGLLLPAG